MRRDVIVSAAAIMGGQGVVLLMTPVLARIYTPDAFGVYAAVVAAAGVIATVAALRFDAAIPAVQEQDVRRLFHLAVLLPAAVVLVIAGAYWIGGSDIPMLGSANQHAEMLLGIAMFQSMVAVCQAMLVRSGKFERSAALRMVQPLTFVVVAATCPWGLLWALAASWIFALVFGVLVNRAALKAFSAIESLTAARRAWKYPLMSSPFALMDTLSLALPMLYIAAVFGSESAGNYSQVQRLVAAPVLLLGAAVSQVFFKHAGDLYRRDLPVEPLLWKVVTSLAAVGGLLVLVVVFCGETLLAILLGEGWRIDAGFVLLAIAPVLIRTMVSPITSVFLISDRVGLGGAWQSGYLAVVVALLVFASGRLDFEEFLAALAGCELVAYGLYLYLAVAVVRRPA